jgi:hypothetical protein
MRLLGSIVATESDARTVTSCRRLGEDVPQLGRSPICTRTLGAIFRNGCVYFHPRDDIVKGSCSIVDKPLEAFKGRVKATMR